MKNSPNKLLILSEIANAHEGDAEKAEAMIIASARAGVDAVKMQKHIADELLTRGHHKYERFKFLEMQDKEWIRLAETAKAQGLKFYCDVLGEKSFEFVAQNIKCDGIKIHSSDLGNTFLLKKITSWRGPVLLSCGGATEREIANALAALHPIKENVVLMHGFQNFPTSLEETNLNRLHRLKAFGCPVGYMDHVDAEDPMAMILPLLAAAAGATVIEKHMTLDRSLKGADYYSSFEPAEMKKLVDLLRLTERVLGTDEIRFGAEESNYRKNFKKHLVASRPIMPGETVKAEDVLYRRAETDCELLNIDEVLGKRVKSPIEEQGIIDKTHLES